ncbi:hypothetical protein DFH06DRAFT_1145035 [Mycena polygramma]|nr:hypothetical protein DFH06DRAFT_1145035 [Mycena polygramma]
MPLKTNRAAQVLKNIDIEPWEVGNSLKRGGFTLHKHSNDCWGANRTARDWNNGGCGDERGRQSKRAAVEIGPRQCAAMENIDAATTRGDAAMWCWVAAVVPCGAVPTRRQSGGRGELA